MENVNKIVITDGIKKIDAYAFDYAYNVTDVHLPSTLKYIVKNAFSNAGITTPKASAAIKATKGTTLNYRVRAYHKEKINGKTKTIYGPWSAVKSYKLK